METVRVGQSASPQGPVSAAKFAAARSAVLETSKFLGRIAVGAAAILVIGLGGLWATDDLGSVQGLSAYLIPVERIASAAPGVKWVQPPASVFLEAGRTPEGGLDVRKMMQAWQSAGMDSRDAWEALNLVGNMRPVLMGRNDQLTATEQLVDMHAANESLQKMFPEVAKNLSSSTQVKLVDKWERDRWEDVINRTEMALSHDLTDQQANAPVSLEQNIIKRLEWNKTHPERTMPLHPLLEISTDASGKFSSTRLLDTLQRAGVMPHVAENLYQDLIQTTQPLQDVPYFEQVTRTEKIDKTIKHMLHVLEPGDLLNIFRAAKNPDLRIESKEDHFAASWQELRTQINQAELAAQTPPAAPVSMQQAKKALEEAVVETGLRRLTPSLWQMRSPEAVMELAKNLTLANQELAHATGWKGGVLGLDGRVELSMGPITQLTQDNADAVALVAADATGRLQMVSGWQELGHEWFHAFDHVTARVALVNPSSRPITENAQTLRGMHDPQIKQAIRALNESLNDGSPEWLADREKQDDLQSFYYFRRNTEAGAYAFAAFLTNSGAKLLAEPTTRTGNSLEPHSMPSIEEQAVQHPYFQETFQATYRLNLSGGNAPLAPVMKNIEQWRSSKTSIVDLRKAPERRPTMR